jgi:DNA (cytosine-5)-methyltransferase 1
MNERARAYYNEIDPYAAQWLRNLIAAGHIAPGEVDERSIEDVHPDDLRTYTQCHFFAGIGVWSYALRRAGWPDDRPVWTGSCPCQPFSEAGKGAGFDDERHLWPAFHWLIDQCRPAVVFGEQVASKAVDTWVDLVHADLEALGYAFGAVPFPSAGVGAPHIRDRLYWVADSDSSASGQGRKYIRGRAARGNAKSRPGLGSSRLPDWLDNSDHAGLEGFRGGYSAALGHRKAAVRSVAKASESGGLADMHSNGCGQAGECNAAPGDDGAERDGFDAARQSAAGPVNGLWSDADWLLCRDGKWRPVEPGTQPLVDGAPARVGRLRAYGNAINAYQAQIFIESVMEAS